MNTIYKDKDISAVAIPQNRYLTWWPRVVIIPVKVRIFGNVSRIECHVSCLKSDTFRLKDLAMGACLCEI